MLMKIKIGFVAIIYLLGGLFMVVFPPKTFPAKASRPPKNPNIRTDRRELNYTFTDYVPSDVIAASTEALAAHNPDVAKYHPLEPTTVEHRTIGALDIQHDDGYRKKGILVVGAVDPMVWAAPNAVLELAHQLLYSPSLHSPFLIDYQWYLIPLANPDGFDYMLGARTLPVSAGAKWRRNMTGAKSRPDSWKKNLANEQNSDPEGCFGTNLNRNFAYHWQDAVTNDPCSQHYPGAQPFSAAETRAVRRYVDSRASSVQLAVLLGATFQPHKESIVYPWLYSQHRASNWQRLQGVGEAAARDARLPSGKLFEVHQSSTDGAVGGSLEDYLMGVAGTPLVYTVRPHHETIPAITNHDKLEQYVSEVINVTLGLIRAWSAASQRDRDRH